MKRLLLTIFAMLTFSMATYAQSEESEKTQLSTSDLTSTYAYKAASRGWASIHDPSVVWDPTTQYFYIYGSHYAGTKTKDFKSFTAISNYYTGGYSDNGWTQTYNTYKAFQSNPTHTVKRCLPGNTTQQEVTLGSFDASAFCSTYAGIQVGERTPTTEGAWVSGDQWAPDIVYNPHMNKWCLYLSLNGDYWASVVVLLTSDSPTGPFTYVAPIVFGGFDGQTRSGKKVNYKDTDLEIVLGIQASLPTRYNTNHWGSFYPNCIDPCSFFDEDGELWLAYGSWSGGIFMLKLDKNTGLRDYTYTYSGTGTSPNANATSDAYFGKKIAGGYYVSGEGPYIQHIGNYYYLFMSYGGFGPSDGYEMRVFRSAKPDGPYTDASGISAIYTGYQLNYGPKAATNRGMKLIGAMNNWGLMTVGECAQGHNSACQDDKGRTFLVCHTKFNDGTAGHQVRTYQMYLNKFGWLCTAPFQFNGEETTDETIATTQPWSAADVEGDYHVLIHPYKLDHNNYAEATPGTIHLSADGKVTGDYTGSWSYTDEGKSYFQLKLKIGSATYTFNGVVVEQTLEGTTAKTLCFTTICSASNNAYCGVPVWGYKLQPQYALAYNYSVVGKSYLKSYLNTNKNVELYFTPVENVGLTWTSSQPDLFSNTGKIAPKDERVNGITLTARMDCGRYYWTNDYNASLSKATTISGDPTSSVVAYYDFDETKPVNLYNDAQEATLGRSNVTYGITPTLEEDPSRFGTVLHQHFGAQGSNSYTRMANPLQGQTDLEGFTVSLWVKRADDNLWDALWGFFNSTTAAASGARLFLTGNSYIGFNDNAGNWFDVNYPEENDTHPSGAYKKVSSMEVGEWHLVTFTYSKANGYKLYLDGSVYYTSNMVYAGSANKAEFDRQKVLDFVTSAQYFYLGLGSFWGSAEACFDDLIIYNRELATADVKGLNTMLNRVNAFNDGTVVGIDGIEADPASATAADAAKAGIYDLMGRKVEAPGKGLYIVDGKKVWFK